MAGPHLLVQRASASSPPSSLCGAGRLPPRRPAARALRVAIDIDLERRRISLSLKQANENGVIAVEHFDPAQYGMTASYDEAGNYLYSEGFDAETGEWLPGFEAQQAVWEKQYEDARKRFEAHQEQITRMQAADVEAALPTSYTSVAGEGGEDDAQEGDAPAARPAPATASAGTLASDEALQALREKLSGGGA